MLTLPFVPKRESRYFHADIFADIFADNFALADNLCVKESKQVADANAVPHADTFADNLHTKESDLMLKAVLGADGTHCN